MIGLVARSGARRIRRCMLALIPPNTLSTDVQTSRQSCSRRSWNGTEPAMRQSATTRKSPGREPRAHQRKEVRVQARAVARRHCREVKDGLVKAQKRLEQLGKVVERVAVQRQLVADATAPINRSAQGTAAIGSKESYDATAVLQSAVACSSQQNFSASSRQSDARRLARRKPRQQQPKNSRRVAQHSKFRRREARRRFLSEEALGGRRSSS